MGNIDTHPNNNFSKFVSLGYSERSDGAEPTLYILVTDESMLLYRYFLRMQANMRLPDLQENPSTMESNLQLNSNAESVDTVNAQRTLA